MKTRSDIVFEYFEKRIPKHYQTDIIRTFQVQMALDISEFLHPNNSKKYLFVEAPVGTGKSLGALIPSLIEKGFQKQKRVLYATSTINLQGQLMREEIPLLTELKLLNLAILAKGKAHYYCHKEYRKRQHQKEYRELAEMLEDFFRTSPNGQRDDFENRYRPLSNPLWNPLSLQATKKQCETCNINTLCPTYKHRNDFTLAENDVVITNHDQLIRSLLNKLDGYSPMVPIDPGIVIIDEAHDFLENFLGQSEKGLKIQKFHEAIRYVTKEGGLKKRYIETVNRLDRKLRARREKLDSLQGRYPLSNEIINELSEIRDILNDSENILFARRQFQRPLFQDSEEEEDVAQTLINQIDRITDTNRYVSWINYEDLRVSVISRRFPQEFRRMMEFLSFHNKVILMSGTLTSDGDFTTLIEQWRLPPYSVETKSIPTSFDYCHQALIYVPDDLVLPSSDQKEAEYLENQLFHIKSLINITQGRTLILTTSKTYMEALYESLSPYLQEKGITFLKQDSKGVEQLADDFKKDETSVLIGSGSFYSGLSVPGTSLISVILTKLPFPVPDDPFLKLVGEGYEDDFFTFITFPHMMVKLHQAIGRLIRDIKDYGVVTILDPRVYSSAYGETIRHSLEKLGYRFTRSFDKVAAFYREKELNGNTLSYAKYQRQLLKIPPLCQEKISTLGRITTGRGIKKMSASSMKEKSIDDFYEITEAQWEFYEKIREQRGLSRKRLKSLKSASDLYEYLYNLYHRKNEDPSIVVQNFPYENEQQRQEFSKFKGSGTVTYVLSKEELEELEKRLEKKRNNH